MEEYLVEFDGGANGLLWQVFNLSQLYFPRIILIKFVSSSRVFKYMVVKKFEYFQQFVVISNYVNSA